MKISFVVICIVIIAFLVGPIMMMKPSPGKKRKERLRLQAREKGLHFSMRNLPQQADEAAPPDAIPVYFFGPKAQSQKSNWLLVRTHYEHAINIAGWWAWQGDGRASSAELALLNQQLPSLPNSVKAVGGGGQGVSIYWDETGDAAELNRLIAFLEELNTLQTTPE